MNNVEDSEDDGIITISSEDEEYTEIELEIMEEEMETGPKKDLENWISWIQALSDARRRERKRNMEDQESQEVTLVSLFDTTGKEEDPGKDQMEVSHTHRYYKEAMAQAQKDAPPVYRYEYAADEDSWVKFRCNTSDIIKDILRKISRMTENCDYDK